MPITQDRMVALLYAARDYQQAFKRAQQALAREAVAFKKGEKTIEQVLSHLEFDISPRSMLTDPETTNGTIMLESRHFSQAAIAHNARQKAKAAKRREKKKEEGAGPEAGAAAAPSPLQGAATNYDSLEPPRRTTAPISLQAEGGLLGKLEKEVSQDEDASAPEKGSFKATDGHWYSEKYRADPRVVPAPGYELPGELAGPPGALIDPSLAEESERERRKALIRQNQSDPEEDVFYPASAEAETEGGGGGA